MSTTHETLSTREAILAVAVSRFAEQRLRRHLAQRHRVAGRHPATEPAAPLPVEGALYGEVFERLLSDWFARLETRSTSEGRGWPKIELVLTAGFRLLRREPRLRPPRSPRGTRGRRPTSASTSPQCSGRCSTRRSTYFAPEMEEGDVPTARSPTALLTGYGALLSYFSDAPFLGGPARRRPDGPRALERPTGPHHLVLPCGAARTSAAETGATGGCWLR